MYDSRLRPLLFFQWLFMVALDVFLGIVVERVLPIRTVLSQALRCLSYDGFRLAIGK